MAEDVCPIRPEPALSFTQGFIVGQLSVVLILAAFIKFFIFGEPPSPQVIATQRAHERRSRTLAHKRSLLSLQSSTAPPHQPSQQQAQNAPTRQKSSILRPSPTPLATDAILSKTYYRVDGHQPESLDWFNVLLAQTIAQFRSDAQHDDAILVSLTKALNGPSRPDFVDEIRVTDLSLGEDFPIFSNCRIIPVDADGLSIPGPGRPLDHHPTTTYPSSMRDASAAAGRRLQARMDVDLSDMITLAVETRLLLNYPKRLTAVLPVALAVSVVRFSGTLSISFMPSNPSEQTPTKMAFTFLDDYRLEFSIRSLVGSRSKLQDVPKIAQLVEGRLHKWFDERAVEPRFQEIALPSMWPRKKNTRDAGDTALAAANATTAASDVDRSLGKSAAGDVAREIREALHREGARAESRARGSDTAPDSLRFRRRPMAQDLFSRPGSRARSNMASES